jgi:cytolysin-activating lysine-acyltransferase
MEQENAATARQAAPARRAAALSRSAALGDSVSILLRAPKYRKMPLEALRHTVLPAIFHNQYRIARVRKPGSTAATPAGLAVWASVSEAVDRRLRAAKEQPVNLAFDEWKSGETLWLIDLVAPSAIAGDMLKEIDEKVGKGRPVYTHIVGAGGALRIITAGELVNSLKKTAAA